MEERFISKRDRVRGATRRWDQVSLDPNDFLDLVDALDATEQALKEVLKNGGYAPVESMFSQYVQLFTKQVRVQQPRGVKDGPVERFVKR